MKPWWGFGETITSCVMFVLLMLSVAGSSQILIYSYADLKLETIRAREDAALVKAVKDTLTTWCFDGIKESWKVSTTSTVRPSPCQPGEQLMVNGHMYQCVEPVEWKKTIKVIP